MADIFISYSSKDRAQAEQLIEMLASAGLSVWIDRNGIDVSTSWSKEIVQAIDACKAFVVLLSPNSVASENVVKEVSLAAERKKKILPLDLEAVGLPDDLAYHLAGIQRAPMTNVDSIIRALGKLGLEATSAPSIKLVKETDGRKSLMILPFEDLSPTADNQWFADGIATELISALSNVKALRVTDQQRTKEFKNYKGQLTIYAREMGIRYFIQGSVRKFGDQIKIASALLDMETGDHLWQDAMRGTMNDIFDIQEAVAKKVVDGLHVILTKAEEKEVKKKPTENAEAYELYLKGLQYYTRNTRTDLERALELYEEAVRIDPGFALAHLSIANASLVYFRHYSRDAVWISNATGHIANAESVLGTSKEIHWIRSILARNQGHCDDSLQHARKAVELDPEYAAGFDALGFAYKALGRREETADARKRNVELREYDRNAHFSYLIALNELGDLGRLAEAARTALPLYERYLRLTPDDLHARVQYVNMLGWTGEHERALSEAGKLEQMEGLDSDALYNIACLNLHEGDTTSALRTLRKSIERGYCNIETLRRDPDLDPLRGMPEFEELMKGLEKSMGKGSSNG